MTTTRSASTGRAACDYCTLEDSVIANGRTGWCPTNGIAIGGDGSGWEFANPNPDNFGVEYTVVRNNIVRDTSKAGCARHQLATGRYIYNNLLADCANIVPACGWVPPGVTSTA